MSSNRIIVAEMAGWSLVAAALIALGALWHHDRTRAWETPRWDDPGLVTIRRAEPLIDVAEPAGAHRAGSAGPWDAGHDESGAGARDGTVAGTREVTAGAERPHAPVETWAVAVNPRCELCRGSLARSLALRRIARAPFRLAVLVVDTKHRPSAATVASLPGDEMRWDSTGAWRERWGHRVYGELLCFDRSGRFVRTLAPLSDSLAARRALRFGESLRRGAGS